MIVWYCVSDVIIGARNRSAYQKHDGTLRCSILSRSSSRAVLLHSRDASGRPHATGFHPRMCCLLATSFTHDIAVKKELGGKDITLLVEGGLKTKEDLGEHF